MQCEHANMLLHKQQTLKNKSVPQSRPCLTNIHIQTEWVHEHAAPPFEILSNWKTSGWLYLQVKADFNAGGDGSEHNHAIIAPRLDYW